MLSHSQLYHIQLVTTGNSESSYLTSTVGKSSSWGSYCPFFCATFFLQIFQLRRRCLRNQSFYCYCDDMLRLSSNPASTRRPGTSPKDPLKVLTSWTSRGPSGDSQGTNRKIDNLMKKVFFSCNSSCFTHLLLFFTVKTNMQKF